MNKSALDLACRARAAQLTCSAIQQTPFYGQQQRRVAHIEAWPELMHAASKLFESDWEQGAAAPIDAFPNSMALWKQSTGQLVPVTLVTACANVWYVERMDDPVGRVKRPCYRVDLAQLRLVG